MSEHTPFDSEWEKFAMKLTKAQLVKVLREQGIQLTAENAALREDKARLDWLEGWGTEFALTLFGSVITRDAIDAAKGREP
jgi:hypothetical protein